MMQNHTPTELSQVVDIGGHYHVAFVGRGSAAKSFSPNVSTMLFVGSAKVNDERTAGGDIAVDFANDATWLRLNWGF